MGNWIESDRNPDGNCSISGRGTADGDNGIITNHSGVARILSDSNVAGSDGSSRHNTLGHATDSDSNSGGRSGSLGAPPSRVSDFKPNWSDGSSGGGEPFQDNERDCSNLGSAGSLDGLSSLHSSVSDLSSTGNEGSSAMSAPVALTESDVRCGGNSRGV